MDVKPNNMIEITIQTIKFKLKDKNSTKKLLISNLWMILGQGCHANVTSNPVNQHQTHQQLC